MRFTPYVEGTGTLKNSAPRPGVKGGPDDGDIALLPLECRWEAWWELVNEEDVPPEELAKDQKERDAFMVKARAAEAERRKQIRTDGIARVPIG